MFLTIHRTRNGALYAKTVIGKQISFSSNAVKKGRKGGKMWKEYDENIGHDCYGGNNNRRVYNYKRTLNENVRT